MNCLKLNVIGFAFSLTAALPLCAEAMTWPDTAQTLCYDNYKEIPCPTDENSPFYGQDAQYQGPTRSYTKLGEGGVELPDDAAEWIMVRDNVTGLIWEMKNNDDGIEDYNNPHDVDNKYSWCNNIDITCSDSEDTEDMLAKLNSISFGGYKDWRNPNIKELSTLFYSGISPMVDWDYFLPNNNINPGYWSSTLLPDRRIWHIYFPSFAMWPEYHYDGWSYTKASVRAVRGGN